MRAVDWLRGVFNLPLQAVFVGFYWFLSMVPVNQHGMFRRFLIGVGIGITHLAVIAFILRHELAEYRKSFAEKV